MASLSHCSTHAGESLGARLPGPLQPLAAVAMNLWWSWHPEASALFEAIDPDRWERSAHNPVKLLRDVSQRRLEQLSGDAELVRRGAALAKALEEELARPFRAAGAATAGHPVAFLCAEYGLDASLPVYSGGLGVLAGDVLKQASDDGLPMVGVGLFYRRGFFHQRLDRSGWQHEWWSTADPEELPLRLEVDARGEPRLVELTLRDHPVRAQIWHVQVGRIPLFLLDTDVPGNEPVDRWITSTLYVGDRIFRVMQYAVLAMGGLRALRALEIDPAIVHLNEGHAALAALELAREGVRSGLPFERALSEARRKVVFTTHTPVPAGNEHYGQAEILELLGHVPGELGIDRSVFLRPGPPSRRGLLRGHRARAPDQPQRERGERPPRRGRTRDVAEARRSRDPRDERGPRPELDRPRAPDPARPVVARLVAHGRRPGLGSGGGAFRTPSCGRCATRSGRGWCEFVRRRTVSDRLARGEPISYVEAAARTFDPQVLTLGFARRVAAYKRLDLLIHDASRALALLQGPRRLQLIISGKAHPSDDGAKRLVQRIFELKDVAGARGYVAFLEDYDLEIAHQLVAGCDVWINLPRAPLEASGTSGMKAALNGGLNLSVLDGWWPEAYDGSNGWALPVDGAPGRAGPGCPRRHPALRAAGARGGSRVPRARSGRHPRGLGPAHQGLAPDGGRRLHHRADDVRVRAERVHAADLLPARSAQDRAIAGRARFRRAPSAPGGHLRHRGEHLHRLADPGRWPPG